MKAYTSKKALQTVVENFRKPRQLFMYHPLKFEINQTFPGTRTTLYSRNVNGTTYWLANMSNPYERDRQIFTHDGKFQESEFLKCFDEFAKTVNLFTVGSLPSTVAENCYTNAIVNYLNKNNIKVNVSKKSAHFFTMNESQIFKYRHYENNDTIPEGYSLDVPVPEEDIHMIVGTSAESPTDEKKILLLREKLRHFPALCARKGDELAGYISSESHGTFSNLHVFDSHRGKNLGETLEIGAAKMAIENGIRPSKFIDTTNQFYMEKTKKSKLMNIVESNGIPVVFDHTVYQPISEYSI
ncbi:unnamed protein product [Caenorhabditis bovis]|uniref:Glycine N-acyltransferase-like protein n=1 Tax=Caenorhabditis bovis TaxID=2654633 RepID=A0A8S1EJ73_9PELO|nr:unnamed protein product [Caenorhabditis bovis]